MRRSPTALIVLGALILTACPNPEKTEAPEDLVGLAKWFWVNQRDAPDEEIEASLLNLHPHIVDLAAEGPAVGPLPQLDLGEIEWTGLAGSHDPSDTVGLYLANTFECDMETLTEIVTAPNQGELHTGVYDEYTRDYQHDRPDFLAGDNDTLLWETSYKATPTVTQYSATTHSGVRRGNPVDGDLGPVILQGTFLPEPADFGGADNHAFDQDYQLEIYYEVDGRIHHLYSMWRSMQIGAFSIEDDIMINFTLDALIQWDQQNEDLCATWPELPLTDRPRARLALGLTLLVLAGCRHELTPRAPGLMATAVYDLSEGARFFDAPFPSDARRTQDGNPDFRGFPNPGKLVLAEKLVDLATTSLDGFDPHGAIYFRFDRPLPFRALPPRPNTQAYRGVTLIDVDPNSPEHGRRFPVWVRTSTRDDGVRPANLLQLLPVPGVALRQGTAYAAIVNVDVDGDGATDLAQPRALRELFSGLGDPRWTNALTPLIDGAEGLGIDLTQVAAATVFTTGHPAARLQSWVDAALAGPAPELVGPLVRDRAYPGFVVLTGKVRIPLYQDGEPPHFGGGGGIPTDDDGRPIQQGEVEAPFVLSIPNGPVPEGGLKHYFYVHGTGGLATQAVDRGYRTPDTPPAPGSGVAGWVAPLGYATSCIAGTYSPDRIGWRAIDGYGAYAFFNPLAMRDNFAQMILEQVLFLRLLEELEVDPALVPETEGKITFAKEARIVGGQSLGSYLSGMLAGLTGVFDGVVLTGAGGTWIEFGFGPKNPIDLAALLDLMIPPQGERLDHHHPFITLFQNAVGPADNTHYTPYTLRRVPPSRKKIPHVLVLQGQHDQQVPVNLQRALTLSLGVDLAGPDVGFTPDEQILPVLSFGGLRQLELPVQGNLMTRDGPRTAVTRRFLEDGLVDGHLVLFQLPEAQRTLLEFVEDVRDGRVPTVR